MFTRKIFTYLEEWCNRDNRKPLVVRGARQVGKAVAIKMFAETRFKNYLYLVPPEKRP